METADSLLEMSLENVESRWSREDEVDRLLEKVEYVESSIDIKDIVAHALGPLPTYSGLESSAKRTADEFEYLLDYQFYAESGKAVNVVYIRDDEEAEPGQNDRHGGVIEGVPDAVLSRITELGKLDDFHSGVAAFHTERRHSVVQDPRPY